MPGAGGILDNPKGTPNSGFNFKPQGQGTTPSSNMGFGQPMGTQAPNKEGAGLFAFGTGQTTTTHSIGFQPGQGAQPQLGTNTPVITQPNAFPSYGNQTSSAFSGFSGAQPAPTFGNTFGTTAFTANSLNNHGAPTTFGGGLGTGGQQLSSAQLSQLTLSPEMTGVKPDDTLQSCPHSFKQIIKSIEASQEEISRLMGDVDKKLEENKKDFEAVTRGLQELNFALCEIESSQITVQAETAALRYNLEEERDLVCRLRSNDASVREAADLYWSRKIEALQDRQRSLQTNLATLVTSLEGRTDPNAQAPCLQITTAADLHAVLEGLYQQVRIYQMKLGLN